MHDLLLSNMASLELGGFTQGKHIDPNSKMAFEPDLQNFLINKLVTSGRKKLNLDSLSLISMTILKSVFIKQGNLIIVSGRIF